MGHAAGATNCTIPYRTRHWTKCTFTDTAPGCDPAQSAFTGHWLPHKYEWYVTNKEKLGAQFNGEVMNHEVIQPSYRHDLTGSKETHWSMNQITVLMLCVCLTNVKDVAVQSQIWSTFVAYCGPVKPKFKSGSGY